MEAWSEFFLTLQQQHGKVRTLQGHRRREVGSDSDSDRTLSSSSYWSLVRKIGIVRRFASFREKTQNVNLSLVTQVAQPIRSLGWIRRPIRIESIRASLFESILEVRETQQQQQQQQSRQRFATLYGGADGGWKRQIDRIGSKAYSFEGVDLSWLKADRKELEQDNRQETMVLLLTDLTLERRRRVSYQDSTAVAGFAQR